DDRESSAGIGVVIAGVAVVIVLMLCGGGAMLAAGLFFYRASARPLALSPPAVVSAVPAQAAHVDVLAIDAEGSLLWNETPVTSVELRERLEVLKIASGPPRSVIVRSDVAAPIATRDEVVQLLNDRGISYIAEESR
ncbi:MAG TPA: biopolymer transporter ExbD, partial [Pirellulaceae bacterium]|nr:biopolymer transporter ExbD [Pirellulaceae bacterium]